MSVIDRLKAQGFRGATQALQLDFRPSDKIAFIYGESGSGKSCVADAMEFALRGVPGSLVEKSGVTLKTHLPSAGQKPAAVKVEVSGKVSGQVVSWGCHLNGNTPILTGGGQRPRVAVLRRSKLADFVEATPADRYKRLFDFIDVPLGIHSEDELREAQKNAKAAVETASASERVASDAIQELWIRAGSPPPDSLQWAETIVGSKSGQSEAERQFLVKLCSTIEELQSRVEVLDAAKSDLSVALTEAAQAKARLAGLSSGDSDGQLAGVLSAAKSYLDVHDDAKTCPVCEKPTEAKQLILALTKRLKAMKAVTDAATAVQSATTGVTGKQAVHRAAVKSVRASAAVMLALVEKDKALSGLTSTLVCDDCAAVKVEGADDADMERAARALATLLNAGKASLLQRRDELAVASSLEVSLARVRSSRKAAELEKALWDSLKAALAIVERCRKEYVNDILKSVADEADHLYKRIHRNEPLGDFKLWLDASRKSSLNLTGTFEGVLDAPPQAYYSESHLDTLGLCIFVALEKRADAANKVLVLDDVLTSVDQPHLEGTMALLQDEASNFGQMVITTHYGRFFEDFKRRHARGAGVQFIKLRKWSFSSGIRADSVLLPVEELQSALNAAPFDRQAAASKAGNLLESVLEYYARKLACRVPLKDTGYVLGDLLPALLSVGDNLKMGMRAAVGGPLPANWEALTPLLQRIWEWSSVRNLVGAHFNLEGANLSDDEVREFGQMVSEFHSKLVCPHCHEMARRNDSNSFWECGCRRFCLMPLRA